SGLTKYVCGFLANNLGWELVSQFCDMIAIFTLSCEDILHPSVLGGHRTHEITYFVTGGIHIAVDMSARLHNKIEDKPIDAEIFVARDFSELEALLSRYYGGTQWRKWELADIKELIASIEKETGKDLSMAFTANTARSSSPLKFSLLDFDLLRTEAPVLSAQEFRNRIFAAFGSGFAHGFFFTAKDLNSDYGPIRAALFEICGDDFALPLDSHINFFCPLFEAESYYLHKDYFGELGAPTFGLLAWEVAYELLKNFYGLADIFAYNNPWEPVNNFFFGFKVTEDGGRKGIRILCVDDGPGFDKPLQAFVEEHTTKYFGANHGGRGLNYIYQWLIWGKLGQIHLVTRGYDIRYPSNSGDTNSGDTYLNSRAMTYQPSAKGASSPAIIVPQSPSDPVASNGVTGELGNGGTEKASSPAASKKISTAVKTVLLEDLTEKPTAGSLGYRPNCLNIIRTMESQLVISSPIIQVENLVILLSKAASLLSNWVSNRLNLLSTILNLSLISSNILWCSSIRPSTIPNLSIINSLSISLPPLLKRSINGKLWFVNANLGDASSPVALKDSTVLGICNLEFGISKPASSPVSPLKVADEALASRRSRGKARPLRAAASPAVSDKGYASMVNSQWPIDYRLSTIDPTFPTECSSPAEKTISRYVGILNRWQRIEDYLRDSSRCDNRWEWSLTEILISVVSLSTLISLASISSTFFSTLISLASISSTFFSTLISLKSIPVIFS
ncbi:MAG: hypothetical protein ACOY3D_01550, partial [Candidatus Omnitrophota bacterium]